MDRFWAFRALTPEQEGDPARELAVDGVIASDSWWGDEVTPAAFRAELFAGGGPLSVRINSPGGDVFAGAEIYNMLREYSAAKGRVTVYIDALAASAASVVAMAGDVVEISPVGILMIHNPWGVIAGDRNELKHFAAVLDEIRESIINAYVLKTGIDRGKLTAMVDAETWMSAEKALALGFVDKIRDWGRQAAIADTEPAATAGATGKPKATLWQLRAAEQSTMVKVAAMVRDTAPPEQPAQAPPSNHRHAPGTYVHIAPHTHTLCQHTHNAGMFVAAPEDKRQLHAARMRALGYAAAVD